MGAQTDRRVRFESIAEEVLEPLQRYLLRRAPRDVADDVLSEVMMVVWRRIDDVPDGNQLPWCYGVARRILANYRRSGRRHLRLVDRLNAEPFFGNSPTGIDDGIGSELEAAIGRLGADDRELVRLWAWEQLEPREIALVLGSTANAISLRLTRVKQRLRTDLQRQSSTLSGHISDEHAKEM